MENRTGFVLAIVFGVSGLMGYITGSPFSIPFVMVSAFLVTGLPFVLVLYKRIDAGILLASLLMGICVHVVYGYFLSMFHIGLTVWILMAPSAGAVVVILFRVVRIEEVTLKWRDILLFVPFLAFVLFYFSAAPCENAKYHLVYLASIMKLSYIPSTYPGYSLSVGSPMGFHFIVYEMNYLLKDLNSLFLSGTVITSLIFVPCFLVGKKIQSEKAGWLCGGLALFVSLAAAKSVFNSSYSSALACTLQGFSIYLLLPFLEKPTLEKAFLIGIVCAAGVEIHPLFLLVFPTIFAFMVYYNWKFSHPRNFGAFGFFIFFLLLSFPYLLRFPSLDYSPSEVVQMVYWFCEEQVTAEMIRLQIGTWVIVLGVMGFLFAEKKVLFGFWILTSALLVGTSVIQVLPLFCGAALGGLYTLAVPLSILGGIFIAKTITSKTGSVFLFSVMVLPSLVIVQNLPEVTQGVYIPAVSENFLHDQEAMLWLAENTGDVLILNEWWEKTGSAWILPLTGKKIVFPPLNFHDHFTSRLKIFEKEKKSFVVAALPDLRESLLFLEEEGIDYIFLSGYGHEQRRKLWNGEVLVHSPNYELVFRKGETYVFQVKNMSIYQEVFSLTRITDIEDRSHIHLKLGKVSYCPPLYLKITYTDSGYSKFDITLHGLKEVLATVPLTNTGELETLYFRLPFLCEDMTVEIFSSVPVSIEEIGVVTSFFGTKISDTVALTGPWNYSRGAFIVEPAKDCQIYLFPPGEGLLKIKYIDDTAGNVDFNMLTEEGTWDNCLIVERKGDLWVKEACIKIPEGYSFLCIGVCAYDNDFAILEIVYEPVIL